MTDTCKHLRGGFIPAMGYWVCSKCWEKLPERPYRVAMVPATDGAENGDAQRQDVVWQAEIHKCQDGHIFASFLSAMAKRFLQRTRPKMSDADAYDLSISVLQCFDADFGDPAYDWSAAGAREMADDEIDNFDSATGGN